MLETVQWPELRDWWWGCCWCHLHIFQMLDILVSGIMEVVCGMNMVGSIVNITWENMRRSFPGSELPVDLKLYSNVQGCEQLIRGDNRTIHYNYSGTLQPPLESQHQMPRPNILRALRAPV